VGQGPSASRGHEQQKLTRLHVVDRQRAETLLDKAANAAAAPSAPSAAALAAIA
jgi:hypothetical protein